MYSSYIIIVPAIILSLYAQFKVQSTFNKYLKVPSVSGETGYSVARRLLDSNGLYTIPIEVSGGRLSDHYDPISRVVRLSEDVYYGNSLASISVAAHETGHAIQHATSYTPLMIRHRIFKVANIGSNLSWILVLAGIFFQASNLILLGIIFFTCAVAFQVITLPVEFNASSRALTMLEKNAILSREEVKGSKKVLDAAALTYVAAALVSVLELLRLILIFNRSND
ncbi:zinc metallopeptidase [Clostridium cylindrosporum]|uniref:Putative neutral zinc metallopeptidase n=1 Tax=Clostridium cylindrosporum DSM 605 TaxID=1121307 RepID=A0A0J8D6H1_CLOCY|nr:zinc metallopeptidase [Clostridium cylindrosporum]KMT21452.1 putative neutral zinc metallopeptidase [Clostridium cylindrosporum DSM 605]